MYICIYIQRRMISDLMLMNEEWAVEGNDILK